MRKTDSAQADHFARGRRWRSAWGVTLSLIGLAFLCWLPAPMWLRHVTGWAVILYGGIMVDTASVQTFVALVGEVAPKVRSYLPGGKE